MAQAQELQCRKDWRVSLFANHDINGWSPEQSLGFDIPAHAPQDLATGCGEANEIRDGCSSHKSNRCRGPCEPAGSRDHMRVDHTVSERHDVVRGEPTLRSHRTWNVGSTTVAFA